MATNNSVGFVYLNPHLPCAHEECPVPAGEPWDMDKIPRGFDGDAYLASNLTHPALPSWNRHILRAMLENGVAGGYTQADADEMARVMPTLMEPAHVVDVEEPITRFKVNDPSFRNAVRGSEGSDDDELRIIAPGDVLRVRGSTSFLRSDVDVKVTDVVAEGEGEGVVVSVTPLSLPPPPPPFSPGETYTLVGHHVYDAHRLACVMFVRAGGASAPSDVVVPCGGGCGGWSSNAASEALRVGAWCSNALGNVSGSLNTYAETGREASIRLESLADAVANVAASAVTRSPEGVVAGIVELETGTLVVASNVMARGTMTLGTPFDPRPPISLDVYGSIRAEDYVVASDARSKHVLSSLEPAACARIVGGMAPVEYISLVDAYRSVSKTKYGFVAQDLSRLDEGLVHRSEDFVPSILRALDVDAHGLVRLRAHGLVAGDRLLVMLPVQGRRVVVTVRHVKDEDAFYVDGRSSVYDKKGVVFVGKQVPDFHTVDQGNMVAILAGALRHALERLERLERLGALEKSKG